MPITVDGGRFRLIHRSDEHHHLWRESESDDDRLVISDHSADDSTGCPTSVEQTEDGTLYVDITTILDWGGIVVHDILNTHEVPPDLRGPLYGHALQVETYVKA